MDGLVAPSVDRYVPPLYHCPTMSLGAIASTIVYVVGTVLYAVLAGLVLRRRGKRGSDSMLMLLGLSAAIWYLGNAVDRFTELLYAGRLADHRAGRRTSCAPSASPWCPAC